MANTPDKRRSHAAYMVEGEGDNATWTEIETLWAHEDGQGFNLKALPVSGRIVIRQRKAMDIRPAFARMGGMPTRNPRPRPGRIGYHRSTRLGVFVSKPARSMVRLPITGCTTGLSANLFEL